MTRLLITYHSEEGQTGKVVERIADVLRESGAQLHVAPLGADPDPADFDGVIFGDSIHLGRHSAELGRWLSGHADELAGVPTAAFQVSLTSAVDDHEHAAEAATMMRDLLNAYGLVPDLVGLFAGALAFTRYGWLKRRLMTHIAEQEGLLGPGRVGRSEDVEFTDWDAVDHFARDVYAVMAVPVG